MMIGYSECPRSQWLISKPRTLEFSVLVLGRKMKLNQREVKRNSFGCGSPFALLWTPICHTRTLYQLLIQDTLKKMFSLIKISFVIWLSYIPVIFLFFQVDTEWVCQKRTKIEKLIRKTWH